MCPSTYNHMWDRARYLWKNPHFIISLAFDAPVRGVSVGMSAPPLVWKNHNGVATRWWKNFEDMFIRFDVIHERDGRTDRQTDTAWQQRPRLCIASRGKNANLNHTKWHSQVTVVAVAYSVPVSDTQWRWRPLRLMSTHCCCLMTS